MQIIINSCTEFYNAEIKKDEKTGELVRIVKEKLIVHPSTKPQTVPDWVKNDSTFKVMEEEGSIIAIQVLSKSKEVQKVKESKEVKEVNNTGWGASQPNIGLGFTGKN